MTENMNLEENIQNFTDILNAKNKQHNLIVMSSLKDALTNDSAPAKDLEVVQKYFDSPLTSTEDKNTKKIAMAAILLAKQNNALPEEMKGYSNEKLLGVVDDSLNHVKIAYQYEKGNFEDEDDAFEQLLDAAAARVKTFIDRSIPALKQMADVAVEEYIPQATNMLMDAVDSAFPQAAPITQYVRQFSPLIAQKVKPIARKGVELLGNFAKQAVETAKETGKSVWKHVVNWLNS